MTTMFTVLYTVTLHYAEEHPSITYHHLAWVRAETPAEAVTRCELDVLPDWSFTLLCVFEDALTPIDTNVSSRDDRAVAEFVKFHHRFP